MWSAATWRRFSFVRPGARRGIAKSMSNKAAPGRRTPHKKCWISHFLDGDGKRHLAGEVFNEFFYVLIVKGIAIDLVFGVDGHALLK